MQLDYFKANKILEEYGIKSIKSSYINSLNEAKDFCGNDRIVLKAISDKAIHKSKAGLVILNVDKDTLEQSYKELLKKAEKVKPYKIIAQKMSEGGIEIILGGRTDQQFGRLILLGLGGIYVEAFKDFSLRLCPIEKFDANEMIDQLKSKNVITYNGKSTEMLVTLLLKISKLLLEHGEIKELDLNPAIIREDSYEIVDIRMII
ncbi:MAG: acetate--CoA ligase family protein [Candidatus Micrarchaeaceae archaeon]